MKAFVIAAAMTMTPPYRRVATDSEDEDGASGPEEGEDAELSTSQKLLIKLQKKSNTLAKKGKREEAAKAAEKIHALLVGEMGYGEGEDGEG